jgi:peroxiredoxin
MKKAILLLLTLATFSCNTQDPLPPNTYEITVTAKGVVNGLRSYIKIIDENRKEIFLDTAIVMNESFKFTGKIDNPAIRVLSVNSITGSVPFVLEPGRLSIEITKDDITMSKVNGSKNNDDYNLFKSNYVQKVNAIAEHKKDVAEARKNNDSQLLIELKEKNKRLVTARNYYAFDFIAEHPKSDVSLLILESQIIGANQNIEKFKSSMEVLKDVINRNDASKFIGRKIETFIGIKEAKANLEIGKIAPDFAAPKPNGEMLALNDIKGKATIIDFWASWCKPCRRENPNVVKVYEKYHDKGLEIISVSLDRNGQKERWLKAIDDDKMNWHHVSNLKYWNEPVARLYNVSGIPATFILDEDGKIVAKKLRGDALEAQIAQMLD